MSAPVRPGASTPRNFSFPATVEHRLSNGLRVLCSPLRRLPAATIVFTANAGAEQEGVASAGVASLAAQSLAEGTLRLGANELVTAFESLGGELGSGADWTHAECGVTVLTPQLDAAMRLLGETVREPALPADGVVRLRQERLSELLQQEAEPRGQADDAFSVACVGTGMRDGLPLGGDKLTVAKCTPELVRSFHQAHYVPDGALLVVTGDVSPDEVFHLAESVYGGWRGTAVHPMAATPAAAPPSGGVQVIDRADAPQSELRIGHASVARTHPDFYALSIANAILGGLFNSRINMNLREAHGYTYGAFSSFDWRRHTSVWSVSTAVKSEVTVAAAKEVLDEIARFRQEPVKADELSLARDYLVGVFPLRFETTAAIGGAIAAREGFGLGADYYDTYRERMSAVTIDDVHRVARTHWRPELLQIVAVGNAAEIREPLTSLLERTK
jgi:zinc protease